jgi:integrase/recombinase XerD
VLKVYRRHNPAKCSHTEREYRRCTCPLWVDGTLNRKRYHKTLRTRDWARAQKLAQDLEVAGKPPESSKTIQEASDAFIRDCESRQLREPSIYKYRLLFKQLKAFAEDKGITYIDECDINTLRQFRESWTNKNYSAKKKLEALRTFFRFVHDTGWLPTNPAKPIKAPKVVEGTTLPFTKEEVKRVLAACDKYPRPDHPVKTWGLRLKALSLLLRFSGLRIADAVTLSKERIKDGVLTLRTAKTGTDVRIPLPSNCIAALEEAGASNGFYFWSGHGTKKSCVGDYQRAFKRLYELANVTGGHAHRWRDTFAVELLLKGVPLADVSVLLGHTSIKITEKHYSPWVKARQEQLESTVRATFEPHNSATANS